MVYMIYNKRAVRADHQGVEPDQDVQGCGRPYDRHARRRLVVQLSLLAKHNGIDASKVPITNVQPNLQEQMLLQGQVDVSAIFTATSYMNLVGMKVDPDKDFRWMFYSDYGVDLYSNGIMVSQKLLKEKPEAVKGLVRAINRAIIEIIANPDAAIEVLMKTEPLMNATIEKARLVYAFKTHFVTPETDELGVGDIKEARMAKAIKLLVETYGLSSAPAVKDVFDRSFLPPKEARMLKLNM